jgi:hypothetical protein
MPLAKVLIVSVMYAEIFCIALYACGTLLVVASSIAPTPAHRLSVHRWLRGIRWALVHLGGPQR